MPSLFHDSKSESYKQQRAVSGDAGITLLCKTGEYFALFTCAKRCALVLGIDGMYVGSEVPMYVIPFPDMHASLLKLRERFSVALIDVDLSHKDGTRFVLIAKIDRLAGAMQSTAGVPIHQELPVAKKPLTLDDF